MNHHSVTTYKEADPHNGLTEYSLRGNAGSYIRIWYNRQLVVGNELQPTQTVSGPVEIVDYGDFQFECRQEATAQLAEVNLTIAKMSNLYSVLRVDKDNLDELLGANGQVTRHLREVVKDLELILLLNWVE